MFFIKKLLKENVTAGSLSNCKIERNKKEQYDPLQARGIQTFVPTLFTECIDGSANAEAN